jgi:hypothetical protein
MSIQVVCPNGHPLTVDESCAGKIGLCSVCKAPVKVPQPDNRQVSEDAVLDFLGPAMPDATAAKTFLSGAAPCSPRDSAKFPKKRCGRCNREVIASLPVCPYCHNSFAGSSDL